MLLMKKERRNVLMYYHVSWPQYEDIDQPMDRNLLEQCQKYMNYHVTVQMSDGAHFDGIIDDFDDEGITMLVPEWIEDEHEDEGTRQFAYGYGRPRRRYRRFRRRRFPFRYFRRIFPIPYYYPYYPWY
jgi:hypothetical protein